MVIDKLCVTTPPENPSSLMFRAATTPRRVPQRARLGQPRTGTVNALEQPPNRPSHHVQAAHSPVRDSGVLEQSNTNGDRCSRHPERDGDGTANSHGIGDEHRLRLTEHGQPLDERRHRPDEEHDHGLERSGSSPTDRLPERDTDDAGGFEKPRNKRDRRWFESPVPVSPQTSPTRARPTGERARTPARTHRGTSHRSPRGW